MLANKVSDSTTNFEDGSLYLIHGKSNQTQGDSKVYDTKLQNLTVYDSAIDKQDVSGVQILCNI